MPNLVFNSLTEALRSGFEPYLKTPNGYVVNRKTVRGNYEWATVRYCEKFYANSVIRRSA